MWSDYVSTINKLEIDNDDNGRDTIKLTDEKV